MNRKLLAATVAATIFFFGRLAFAINIDDFDNNQLVEAVGVSTSFSLLSPGLCIGGTRTFKAQVT
ncbi:MAG: hypothetical protein SGJ02_02900 [bacterium]|nr:hypothetical protein [bacterium]